MRFEVKREAHLEIRTGKNKGSGYKLRVTELSIPWNFVLKSNDDDIKGLRLV
jgi:hypothetical protein